MPKLADIAPIIWAVLASCVRQMDAEDTRLIWWIGRAAALGRMAGAALKIAAAGGRRTETSAKALTEKEGEPAEMKTCARGGTPILAGYPIP